MGDYDFDLSALAGGGSDLTNIGADTGTSMPASTWMSALPSQESGGGFNWNSALDTLGGVAKTGIPLLTAGAGIFGAVNNLKAQNQAARSAQLQRKAQEQQMQGVSQAQALVPEIAATARKVDPIAGQVQSGVVKPVLDFATQRLQGAEAGQIPPQVEALFQQSEQAELAQLRDYLARSGQADSSARVTLEGEVHAKYQAKRAEYLRQSEQDALKAFEQAQGGMGAAANILGVEGAGLGGAASAATGAASAAGGAANIAAQDQKMLLDLIANANKALAALTGAQA